MHFRSAQGWYVIGVIILNFILWLCFPSNYVLLVYFNGTLSLS